MGMLPRSVLIDSRRVRQILFNLISNALKFTKANRQVAVTLGMDTSGQKLCFEVKDQGIGITESQMGRLFQPFEQGDSSTTRLFGGSGLGLSISKRLAQMMGGDIIARSNPGKGSQFVFELPIDVSQVGEWLGADVLEIENVVEGECRAQTKLSPRAPAESFSPRTASAASASFSFFLTKSRLGS